jgi:hypothetical protein
VAVVQYTYTQTIQRITQNKQYRTTQKLRIVRAVLRLCGFYPGICLTTEEKAWKHLTQGSHTYIHTVRIHIHNNKNTKITLPNINKPIYTLIKIEPKEYEGMKRI